MRTGIFFIYKNFRLVNNNALSIFSANVDKLLICVLRDETRYSTQCLARRKTSDVVLNAHSAVEREFIARFAQLNHGVVSLSMFDTPALLSLLHEHSVTDCALPFHPNYDLSRMWLFLRDKCQNIRFHLLPGNTLFQEYELPFKSDSFPKTFSEFRRKVNDITIAENLTSQLPDLPRSVLPVCSDEHLVVNALHGESAAAQHLLDYFCSRHPSHYKKTRNQLSGEWFSTGFSPFLALGTVSVHEILSRLQEYQLIYGQNDSTEWIYFELLWREYFYWYAKTHGTKLFLRRGLNSTNPLTSFYASHFKAWCEGNTEADLVNAIMIELNTTGWISNRSRQITASYLVNELSVDWRYGAAYFEQTLIDYDVAINWGNWQYIAGVGADPRGGRHFNIDKQSQLYDELGHYRRQWLREHNAERSL
ncbi:DASH family cryptochrome [Pseudoalteromonas xiamenensis]